MSGAALTTALWIASALGFGYFVLLNGVYLLTTAAAFVTMRRYGRQLKLVDVEELVAARGVPPITLLAPAYNEEANCVEATRSLLTLRYPAYEIVVVNDGSRDGTLARLREAFALEPAQRMPMAAVPTERIRGIYHSAAHPNLWVIDKENGGKADALNAGLNYSRTPLFCAIDADSLLERDALIRLVRPFLQDASTVAAGGTIRIANGCRVKSGSVREVRLPRNLLARFQVMEYLRAFLAGRMGWDALGATLIISGAFGIFRRSTVVEAGGYARDTVGEDMELVVRLHRHCRDRGIPYRIRFVPDPVAWTECPESLRVLGRQRDRWQRGLMQALARHRAMMLRPRFRWLGMLVMPYYLLLEGFGPALELLGYLVFAIALALGALSPIFALSFFLVAFVLGGLLSVAAVALEELSFHRYERFSELLELLLLAGIETFGYRQLSSWWRLRGLVSALRGRQGWGAMERRGFAVETRT
ncbi:MAG TPA: glycosyltransferase [Longimicrobiales bacterium]